MFTYKRPDKKYIRVFAAPSDPNPYQEMLAKDLVRRGVHTDICDLRRKQLLTPWKFEHDILHLHWLSCLYNASNYIKTIMNSRILIYFIRCLKKRKISVLVTMHNVVPHYRKYPEVDAYVRRLMSREADGIIFHDEHARNDFMHKFGNISGKQFVVPHAVYPESLVPLPSRELARHYFRIPPEPLCALFLGQARKQKGYDYILSALDSFQKKGIHVVFAARGADFRQRSMAWKGNITFLPYFVPNYEMPVLFSAVDVVLLPYRSCTTSGLAVLSVGFGRPFVSSKLAPLLRLCSAGLGVSCDVENPIEFADHVLLAGDMVHNPRYVRGRNKFLEEHSLDRVAADTFEIYARLVNR